MDIPAKIIDSIKNRNLVLFIGAGYSSSAPVWLPNWTKLTEIIISDINKTNDTTLNNLSYKLRNGTLKPIEILDELERLGYKDQCHESLQNQIDIDLSSKDLSKFGKLWQISDKIITTNYDKTIDLVKPANVEVVSHNDIPRLARIGNANNFLLKIHGSIDNTNECILFSSDYQKLYKTQSLAIHELMHLVSHSIILYIGFSLEDPYVIDILEKLATLYEGYKDKSYSATVNGNDFSKFDVEVVKLNDWGQLDVFIDKLIEIKKSFDYLLEALINEYNKKKNISDSLEESDSLGEHEIKLIFNDGLQNIKNTIELKELEQGGYNAIVERIDQSFSEEEEKHSNNKTILARKAYDLARFNRSIYGLEKALFYSAKAVEYEPNRRLYLYEYAANLFQNRFYDKAIERAEEAIKSEIIEDDLYDASSRLLYQIMGLSWLSLGDTTKAIEYINNCLKLSITEDGEININTAAAYNNLGEIYKKKDDYRSALDNFFKSLRTYRNWEKGHDFKWTEAIRQPSIYLEIGSIVLKQGKPCRAIILFKKGLQLAEGVMNWDGEPLYRTAEFYKMIGFAFFEMKDYKEAIRNLNKAQDIIINSYGKRNDKPEPQLFSIYMQMGVAFRELGEYENSIRCFNSAKSVAINNKGAERKQTADAYFELGKNFIIINKYIFALIDFSKSKTLINLIYPPGNGYIGTIDIQIKTVLAKLTFSVIS